MAPLNKQDENRYRTEFKPVNLRAGSTRWRRLCAGLNS